MAQGQHLFIFTMITIVLLIILSKCNSYPLFNEIAVPERPKKFNSPNDVDRYVNRMKQYYETMAQLKLWRRDIDQSDEDSDETLQDMLRQYKIPNINVSNNSNRKKYAFK